MVEIDVGETQATAARAGFESEAAHVRQMAGNLAFRLLADPAQPGALVIWHEWQSEAEFDAYLASPSFARLGEVLRPIAQSAPVSRRFHADLANRV